VKYWLMKSEPSVFSIDDLARGRVTGWEGVRNYQARNFMRDEMRIGDLALFYHSNANPPGVAGVMRVVREAYPDDTAGIKTSPYYDERTAITGKGNPWVRVDLEIVEKFAVEVSLARLRDDPCLDGLLVTRKGSRLSVQPVAEAHFLHICRLAGSKLAV
jgi:predicted RNA-binding protein with PUA-like domain